LQNDLFSEVFDGAIDQYFDEASVTEEEQDFQNEEEIEPSLKSDIENLLTNGRIFKEIELAGHTFVMRTLTIGEELAVAEICGAYDGNFAQAKAIATATVAASIETIDGRPLMRSLGPDAKNNIRQKFQYIRNKWYWVIINDLYEHYELLLGRQINAFQELKGK
jgi:hypothetical protein